jgi:hypothetical protein
LIRQGRIDASPIRPSKPALVPVVTNAEVPMARVLLGGEQHRQEMAARQVNPVCFACEMPYEECTCCVV